MSINKIVPMDIYIDIDETICRTPNLPGKPRDYSEAIPIPENIALVNKLYDAGHTVVYWTARGGKSGIDWTDITKQQLEEWIAKHHELRLDKPPFDLLIDDKALNSRVWEKGGNETALRVILQQLKQ